MSERYEVYAVGGEGFIAPFKMTGFGAHAADTAGAAERFIMKQDLKRTLFVMEEKLAGDEAVLSAMEDSGANIIILKGWGRSAAAERKIREASIKAIGTDIK